jgi:hypothetical protein
MLLVPLKLMHRPVFTFYYKTHTIKYYQKVLKKT